MVVDLTGLLLGIRFCHCWLLFSVCSASLLPIVIHLLFSFSEIGAALRTRHGP